MKTQVTLITAMLVIVCSAAAMADTIALKDGTKLEGTLANSQQLKSGASYAKTISILVGDDLMRVPVEEIDYITIGEGVDMLVIDPNQLPSTTPSTSESAPGARQPLSKESYQAQMKRLKQDQRGGVLLGLVGAAAIAVGLAVPFGGEKLTVTASDVDYDEKSRNALNYVLMAGGGVAMIGGVVITTTADKKIKQLEEDYRGIQVSFAF